MWWIDVVDPPLSSPTQNLSLWAQVNDLARMLLSNEHNAFPVVDSNGRKEGVFLGLVQRPQLEALLLTPELWQLPSLGHASPLSGARNGSFCAAAEAAAIDWSSDLGMSSSDDSFEAGEWFATCGERAAEAEEEEEEKEEEVAGEGDLRVLRLGAGQTEEGPETTEADRGIWAALISSMFEPSTVDQVTPRSPVISLQPPPLSHHPHTHAHYLGDGRRSANWTAACASCRRWTKTCAPWT
jgi:hypothetical protein